MPDAGRRTPDDAEWVMDGDGPVHRACDHTARAVDRTGQVGRRWPPISSSIHPPTHSPIRGYMAWSVCMVSSDLVGWEGGFGEGRGWDGMGWSR
jgi:hypothetical protein